MKTESTPPEAPPSPPTATTPTAAKAASTSPTASTAPLADDAPRAKKAGVGPVRTRAAPSKTFVCRGFGDCSMVFSRSEHLARHVRKHTGERPFACHCGKQFSRLDNLRQHAQTVHSDKSDLNERMMRELTSLHTALAATSHRNLPRLSPSQGAPQASRSQPSTPNDPHPPGVVPSMAYDNWRREDQHDFLGQSFRPDQSFRSQNHLAVPFPPTHSSYAPGFQPANDVHAHSAGRHGVGRFLAADTARDGPFQRANHRDGYADGLDPRSVDDGGGSKPFTSGGSAGGGLPPISSLIPRAEPQSVFPPASRPATAGSLSSWRTGALGRPATSSGWLPPLADRPPGLAARPATAAAPLGFGSAAPSRPGTSSGPGDRGGDVFAFEPPALATPRYRGDSDDGDRSARDWDEPRYGLPFGLRPGTAPAASFDRARRGREWERERAWYGRDQSHERDGRSERDGDQRRYERERSRDGRRPADEWDSERLPGYAPSSPDGRSPPMEFRRRGSGGLYPGDPDREAGLLSPNGGGYDSPFSWHPPGLAPRKRSYDFGPGDAGADSRPSSRRLTLMELCSNDPAPDDAATPLGVSTNGKSPVEWGRESAPLVRPATVGGGDSGGLPGIASFGFGARTDAIHERTGALSLGPPGGSALPVGGTLPPIVDRGSSLPPPPSPPPTALGPRDDDDRECQRERVLGRDAAPGSYEPDDGRGTSVSDAAVGASTAASHWRGERERLRGQVRTPISPPPTATGVRAGSAS